MVTIDKHGKTYRVQIRKNGITRSKSFPSKALATAWAKQMEKKVAENLIEPTTLLLKEALERLEAKGRAKFLVAVWLKHPLAKRDMTTIKPKDIATYRDQEVRKARAPKTIRNHVSLISQVYRIAFTECKRLTRAAVDGCEFIGPTSSSKAPSLRSG